MTTSKKVALTIVVLWFLLGGIGHFVVPDFFVGIMPPYIPYHLEVVYISGVFEIIGALGLLFAGTRRWAGYGLILLTLCVTPANIYMWQNPELFSHIPSVLLSVRLVVQVMLLGCIWWGSQPAETANLTTVSKTDNA